MCSFFKKKITQYNTNTHNTHPYEHTYANPTPISTFKGEHSVDLEIPQVTHRYEHTSSHALL
jgi:hypothetical protein